MSGRVKPETFRSDTSSVMAHVVPHLGRMRVNRIGELSGNERFVRDSVALLTSAFAAHDTPAGYCTHVRRDGSMVELPRNSIDPKYNGLALKGMISLATLDRPIYGSPDLADLFKDR